MKVLHNFYVQIVKLVNILPFPATRPLRTFLYSRINQQERYQYLLPNVSKASVTTHMQHLVHIKYQYGGSKKTFVLF
jgi:hypothetical protein